MAPRALSQLPALPLAAGIVAGVLLWPVCPFWWYTAVVAAVGVALMLLRCHVAAIAVMAVSIGNLSAWLHEPAPGAGSRHLEGVFAGEVTRGNAGMYSHSPEVRIDSFAAPSGLLEPVKPFVAVMAGSGDYYVLDEGQRIRFSGNVTPLRRVADFPYQSLPYARAVGHGAVALAYADSLPEVLSAPSWAASRRAFLLRCLLRGGASDGSLAIFAALFTADRDWISPDTSASFRTAGLAHALALSGFHVAFIVAVAALALFPLRAFPRMRWLRHGGVIAIVWAFAALVGFPASVVRASAMLTVYLLARLLGRPSSAWNALLLSIAIIVGADPRQLAAPGFQLSVAAVAGILAFARHLNPVNPRRRLLYICVETIVVPLSATLGTCVLSVVYFHSLPVYFLIANVLTAILFPLLMSGGLLLLAAGALGYHSVVIAAMANGMCELLTGIVNRLALLPGATIDGIYLQPVPAIIFAGVIIALAVAVSVNRAPAWIALGCMCMLCVGAAFSKAPSAPSAEAFVVSLGHDTSVLMRCGSDARAFVTIGPKFAPDAIERLRRSARHYLEANRCDSLAIEQTDFAFGPFRRSGQFLLTGRCVTAVLAHGKRVDSIVAPVDYVLVTNRCKADPLRVLQRLRPDTVVLGADLSVRRREGFRAAAAADSIPTVDMRQVSWRPPVIF